VLSHFSKVNNQPNNQQTTSRPPADHHNQEEKKRISKESLPSPLPSVRGSKRRTEDFSSNDKIEVYPKVFLTQAELDECIAIKGTIEDVQYAISYISRSPGRRHVIQNWPLALSRWKTKHDMKHLFVEHEEMAERLSKIHEDYDKRSGYRCYIYKDKKKDQRGLLFESSSSYVEPFFFSFSDGEFRKKVHKFLFDKKMQEGRIVDD
jgi:hypothetical protein